MTLTPLAVFLALGGAAWGVAADRIAVRWPEHDEGHAAGHRPGWRTVVVGVTGAVAFGALPSRLDGALALGLFGAWFAVLVLLLATDLDQRLMPDVLTLPVLPVALVYAASGQNPLVGDGLVWAVVAALAIPALLYLPSIPFGAGAFGLGDVKLLAGVGLASGLARAVTGVVVGLLLSGAVIVVLLAARRITLRDYIPFGPFLILGALWGVLGPR